MSAKKPVVLVVLGTHGRGPGGVPRAAVKTHYLEALTAHGAEAILVPPGMTEVAWEAAWKVTDAVFLTGGEDVNPAHYGEAPHPNLGELDEERDLPELWVTRRAFAEGRPLLGICRGAQVMNVALGGTLYQDLPSQFPGCLPHANDTPDGDMATALHHHVRIAPGSELARCIGAEDLACNSRHHQGVKDVAPGLQASAWAPDGVIEAVEAMGRQGFLGIQGHPENLWFHAEPRWRRLFTEWIRAVGAT